MDSQLVDPRDTYAPFILTNWETDETFSEHPSPEGCCTRMDSLMLAGLVLSGGLLFWGALGLGKLWRFVTSVQSPKLRECLPFIPSWVCLVRKKKLMGVLNAVENHISELEGGEQQMGKWVSEIAHDLNAPLGAIQGYAEILSQASVRLSAEDAQRYTEAILSLGERIQGLVDDLLQISLVRSGGQNEKFELLSLAELISDTVLLFKDRFLQNGLVLTMETPEDLCLMMGNPRLLQRMVQNFLENAMHYSRAGTMVEIRVRARKGEFEFSISNWSEGGEEGNLSHLFKRYERGMEASRQGAGLGLSIVKEIAELHQAQIAGFRAENGQTTFVVHFGN